VRLLVLALAGGGVLSAQAPQGPTFEVASVKQNTSGELRSFISLGGPSPFGATPANTLTASNMTLRMMIVQAYTIPLPLERFVLTGGSQRILMSRFDVRAKPTEGTTPSSPQMFQMLKALLADRFSLRVHTETRQIPIYAMTVIRDGKLGPDIRESRFDCDAVYKAGRKPTDPDPPLDSKGRGLCWSNYDFGQTQGARYAGPLSMLASRAQSFVDRPVVDATGLTGNYEWQLTFTMKDSPDAVAPSIYTAFQEQLGLKLEPRTGPFEVYVIDSVEMPTPD
jgi:uncharacterized protein (TIGR03435 family)